MAGEEGARADWKGTDGRGSGRDGGGWGCGGGGRKSRSMLSFRVRRVIPFVRHWDSETWPVKKSFSAAAPVRATSRKKGALGHLSLPPPPRFSSLMGSREIDRVCGGRARLTRRGIKFHFCSTSTDFRSPPIVKSRFCALIISPCVRKRISHSFPPPPWGNIPRDMKIRAFEDYLPRRARRLTILPWTNVGY